MGRGRDDFCLGRDMGLDNCAFSRTSSRSPHQLTGCRSPHMLLLVKRRRPACVAKRSASPVWLIMSVAWSAESCIPIRSTQLRGIGKDGRDSSGLVKAKAVTDTTSTHHRFCLAGVGPAHIRQEFTLIPQFGSCTLAFIWAFFRLPEMRGRSYREIDVLFARRIPARDFRSTIVEKLDELGTRGVPVVRQAEAEGVDVNRTPDVAATMVL